MVPPPVAKKLDAFEEHVYDTFCSYYETTSAIQVRLIDMDNDQIYKLTAPDINIRHGTSTQTEATSNSNPPV